MLGRIDPKGIVAEPCGDQDLEVHRGGTARRDVVVQLCCHLCATGKNVLGHHDRRRHRGEGERREGATALEPDVHPPILSEASFPYKNSHATTGDHEMRTPLISVFAAT